MKKYFVYELKSVIMPTIVATCVACLVYVFSILAYNPVITYGTNEIFMAPPVAVPVIIGLIMCFIAPAYSFSYMMNSRSVDSLFSMPIKREKLYLVKSIVCFLQVIVPYAVSYWLGFVMIALKTGATMLDLIMFLPLFFAEIPIYALLLGLVTFGFTRANRVLDGIIMMGAYCVIFSLVMQFVNMYIALYDLGISVFEDFQPLYSIWFISDTFAELIARSEYVHFWTTDVISCFVMLVLGVLGWLGLFLTAKHRKAEDAGRVSDSVFAYRSLIPVVTVMEFAILFGAFLIMTFRGGSGWSTVSILEAVGLVLEGVGSYLAYCFFRRSFKLKKSDFIALAVSICIGLLLGVIPALIPLPLHFNVVYEVDQIMIRIF